MCGPSIFGALEPKRKAAEQRACRRADRTEGVAASGDQPEPADREAEVLGQDAVDKALELPACRN
jgi:hypothetical protein